MPDDTDPLPPVPTGPTDAQAELREDPDWLYDPENEVLYGPEPGRRIRRPVATRVPPDVGPDLAAAMNQRRAGIDAQETLREQIARALWDACKGEGSYLSWDDKRVSDIYRRRHREHADAVLALPAVRDALDAQEKVRRVEALAEEMDACYEPSGESIRRALAGES